MTDLTCPHCHAAMTRSAEVSDGMVIPRVMPEENAIVMCIRCGDWSVAHGERLVKPTNDELADIRSNTECQRMVRGWLDMVMERYRERRSPTHRAR